MNYLSINKGWINKETSCSIRVKNTTPIKIFKYIQKLKEWFTLKKEEFWFLGNLSPVVNKELWKKGDQLTISDIDNFFLKKLEGSENTLTIFGRKLIWNFDNINPTGKYRFKTRENLYTHGNVKSSASFEITDKDFLEIQIGYDKKIEDFYNKKSIHKLGFINNKKEQKFIFELSDIFCWGLIEKHITKKKIKEIINEISKLELLEEKYKIKWEKPIELKIASLNFNQINVLKPSFVCDIKDDFIEINIDYKQKALGTQAMLFLNLSAKNFKINNETIVGKKISKKDSLSYVIDRKKYCDLFCNLIKIFGCLSKQHNKDILNILEKILCWDNKKD